jgi:hypothetical protein
VCVPDSKSQGKEQPVQQCHKQMELKSKGILTQKEVFRSCFVLGNMWQEESPKTNHEALLGTKERQSYGSQQWKKNTTLLTSAYLCNGNKMV